MTFFPTLAVEVLRMVIFKVRMGIEQQLKELEKRRMRCMRLLADRRSSTRECRPGASPSLRPRTESGRIYLGLPEAPRRAE